MEKIKSAPPISCFAALTTTCRQTLSYLRCLDGSRLGGLLQLSGAPASPTFQDGTPAFRLPFPSTFLTLLFP